MRWSIKPEPIEQVMINPGMAPGYRVKNHPGVVYTKNQLQVVKKDEQKPGKEAQRKFEVSKIVDKEKQKGRIHYKVRWKGYGPEWDRWLPRSQVVKEIPDIMKEFEVKPKQTVLKPAKKLPKKKDVPKPVKKAVKKTPEKKTTSTTSRSGRERKPNKKYE